MDLGTDRGTPAHPAALIAEHEELLGFLYMCPAGILKLDGAGAVRMLNPKAAQLLMPIARSANIGNLFDVLQDCAPELRNLAADFAAPSGTICDNHRVFVGRNGPGPRVLACTLLKIDSNCMMALLGDVTQQVEQERRLKQTESWFAALITGVKNFALFTLALDGRINSWSGSGRKQTGFSAAEAMGQSLHLFYHPDENRQGRAAEHIDCATQEGWQLEEGWCVRRDGSRYWCQILVAAIEGPDGTVSGFSVVMRDITERQMTGEQLRRLLTTDHLTGAVNRAHFDELAEREVARWRRYGQPLSAIMLDIDHFKRVNDTLGHLTGDHVLQGLVASCRTELRPTDILARLGGEEFVVLLPGVDLPGAVETAERLRRVVSRDLASVDGRPVGATISLGCATMTSRSSGLEGLLDTADWALYRAKALGRDRVETGPPDGTNGGTRLLTTS